MRATAILYMFGWSLAFSFVCGVTKNMYILSMVIGDVFIKDILGSFIYAFAFNILGFSFAMNVLLEASAVTSV